MCQWVYSSKETLRGVINSLEGSAALLPHLKVGCKADISLKKPRSNTPMGKQKSCSQEKPQPGHPLAKEVLCRKVKFTRWTWVSNMPLCWRGPNTDKAALATLRRQEKGLPPSSQHPWGCSRSPMSSFGIPRARKPLTYQSQLDRWSLRWVGSWNTWHPRRARENLPSNKKLTMRLVTYRYSCPEMLWNIHP